MSEQTLKRLVGALVVLVALWGLTTFLSSDRSGGRAASGAIASFFDGVDQASVGAVRMATNSQETELTKDMGSWLVNGFRTDSGTVARFWSMMEAAQIEDLIATNPANHERMDITDDGAWQLEVDVGGETRTLLVGGSGPRFATVYARMPGENDVYVLQADLRSHMRRQLDEWRNKRISAVDTTSIGRVEIERGGASVALVRGDSTWVFDDGSSVAPVPLRNLMMDLSTVTAAAILAETDSLVQMAQAASTTVFDASGQLIHRLTLGEGENDRWVRAEGDETVYRLQAFRVDRLFPTRETLTPEPEGS